MFEQAKIFMRLICEGANCPTRPKEGVLDAWATPKPPPSEEVDNFHAELNELAQKLDLNYDPLDISSVPWIPAVARPRTESNFERRKRISDLVVGPQGKSFSRAPYARSMLLLR